MFGSRLHAPLEIINCPSPLMPALMTNSLRISVLFLLAVYPATTAAGFDINNPGKCLDQNTLNSLVAKSLRNPNATAPRKLVYADGSLHSVSVPSGEMVSALFVSALSACE